MPSTPAKPSTPRGAKPVVEIQSIENSSAATTPIKRGPGRPRKDGGVTPSSASTTPKRGPGRPRKDAATTTAPLVASETETPPKRGPGRPRKDESTEATPKRGPGRPRKDETVEPPAKRGPGRPRKDEAETTPKRGPGRPRKDEVKEETSTTPQKRGPGRPRKEESPETPAKRGPGRPRKDAAAVTAETPPKRGPGRPRKDGSAPVPASSSTSTPPPVKRGPGRPRKDASVPVPSPAQVLPVKRGPGRPRKDGTVATPKRGPGRPRKDATAPLSAPSGSAKRVAESLAAAAGPSSTPRKRPRTSDRPLPSFDEEVFGSPSASTLTSIPGAISRETFRANEALRRQREARNFTFEGDVHSPRQTRSGRVVDAADQYGGEYGDEEDEDGESMVVDEREDMEVEEEARPDVGSLDFELLARPAPALDAERSPTVTPLLLSARPHVLGILSTLTGRETEPTPFANEDANETLQGVVALLRGTVERGEGNSALITGPRGVGKTKTIERALQLLPGGKNAPIVVRLSGHAQTDDRRAIREMGRQIAAAEGRDVDGDDDEEAEDGADGTAEDYAPTTLPSHLLALLTAPSPRAIIVVIDEFDLFTEHARQALLYCLLDVVQSVQTGPVESTGRGLAVIGLTSRVNTLLLLEKRVKSRFSHRVWRVTSPLAPGGVGWSSLLYSALVPWHDGKGQTTVGSEDKVLSEWMEDWAFAVETLLKNKQVSDALDRLTSLTTDVRLVYRPFIGPITSVLSGELDFLSVSTLTSSVASQLELSGWGGPTTSTTTPSALSKLRGLPHPALGVLIVAKHLAFAGRTEFSLAQVEDEYLRFARTRLVGSGRARWPLEILRRGFDHCRALGLLAPAGPAGPPRWAKVRAALAPHDVVQFFRGDGGAGLGPELVGWGKLAGGHA